MDAIAKKPPSGKKKENSAAVKSKKTGGKKKENSPEATKKQPGEKKKENPPVKATGKSKEEKQAANEEKEEKKREKLQKKKALDERDFNVLSQLSQLNKAVVVVDEEGREIEEKEEELKRKDMELNRREKEVQRKEKASNKENRQNISSCRRTEDDDLVFDHLKSHLSSPSNRNDDTDEEEYGSKLRLSVLLLVVCMQSSLNKKVKCGLSKVAHNAGAYPSFFSD